MPGRVVDASVLGAWCFREPRAAEALGLFQESDLYAPILLAYELTSVARKKAVAEPQKVDTFSQALQSALALPIQWNHVDQAAVLRLALNANLTTYDASYLYLARLLGVPLLTFDGQLERASQER